MLLVASLWNFIGEGNGTPLQYFCLENPMDGEAWWAAVHGVARVGHDWATSLSLSCTGEGNGNPLQCSCLENPKDGRAWWAAVYGVAQSRTRLKRCSCSSSSSSRFLIALLPMSKCLLISWLHSDFGVKENEIWHCFHIFPVYLPWSNGARCHDLCFMNVSFKPAFSLSFHFHQEAR